MSLPPSPPSLDTLERAYEEALAGFARGAGESALAQAYDLGRRALNGGVSLLDLLSVHERALTRVASSAGSLQAGDFLSECLSPYEMSLRAHRANSRLLGLSEGLARQNSELDRAHSQLRSILDATTAVIYLRDTTGKFLFVNRGFEAAFDAKSQRSHDNPGGSGLSEAIDARLLDGDRKALERAEPLEMEESLPHPDGERTYLSLKVPLVDSQGVPYAVCCVATDISERKRSSEAIRAAKEAADAANRELRATQAQLVQSAKMASLGQLVAGIAHEVNNPLAFVLAHLDTVRRIFAELEPGLEPALDEPLRRSWDRAGSRLKESSAGLERIRDLILKLRVFSRLDEGERGRASMRECIDSVLTILGHRARGHVELVVSCREPDVIECYPGLLNQALMNLVTNAIDASPSGGRVTITSGVVDGEHEIRVSDAGAGVPEALRDRVFEPFFTTKPPGQGTGLGLSITYSIVRKHGGTLQLSCPASGGTTAILRLPVEVRKTQQKSQE